MLAEIFYGAVGSHRTGVTGNAPAKHSRFVLFVLGARYGFRNGGADPTDAVLGVAREKASTGSIQNN